MKELFPTRDYQAKITEAEKSIPKVQQSRYALRLHLMPPVGWINDPNGLCQKDGIYHIFFQYSPFDARGGEKFWGHFRTCDLIHYEYTGVPLSPDVSADRDGVFSGCALVDENKIKLYYTGNVYEEGTDGIMEGREANTLYVETADGIATSPKKCLMTNADYPSSMTCQIRDPKVFRDGDTYYMVQGAWSKDYKGHVLVFISDDSLNWHYSHALTTSEAFGYMWECPALFSLDGQQILSVSPQGVESEEFRYQNIYQSGYFLIDGDFKNEYRLKDFYEWDMGFDFYAPQIFEDEKGRQILIGWMGIPDAVYTNPTVEDGWQHTLTFPRELTLSSDKTRVLQSPVAELKNLRTDRITGRVPNDHQMVYEDITLCELIMEHISASFSVTVADDLHFTWNSSTGICSLFFTGEAGYGRTCRKAKAEQIGDLRMYVDTSAVEIYLNHGETVFSTRYYPKEKTYSLTVECDDCMQEVWALSPITTTYHNPE